MHYEEIETLLTEVEAVVNSHPITLTHTSSEEQCATVCVLLRVGLKHSFLIVYS